MVGANSLRVGALRYFLSLTQQREKKDRVNVLLGMITVLYFWNLNVFFHVQVIPKCSFEASESVLHLGIGNIRHFSKSKSITGKDEKNKK